MRWSALGGLLAVLPFASPAQPASQHPLIPPSVSPPTPSYAVSSLVRTIEVGGTITREQAVVTLKPISGSVDGGKGEWWMPVEEGRIGKVSWVQVVEGKPKAAGTKRLEVSPARADVTNAMHYYKVSLPPASSPTDTLTLTISLHYTHLTTPKPSRLSQEAGDKQGMVWTGDLLGGLGSLSGALADDVEVRVKVKAPSPKIYGYEAPDTFTALQTAGSNTVNFANRGTALAGPQVASVHYNQPIPIIAMGYVERLVEVSHWGNNVAVEDRIKLENRGPVLKDTFSRLAHQTGTYMRKPGFTSHVLTSFSISLPPGTKSPYYIDTIGNVSTSMFSPSPRTSSKLKKSAAAKLELQPRYPIVGGWNYSYTVGWNIDAGSVLRMDKETGEYVLSVPMFTKVDDVAVDEATMRVRLPEGAKDVKVVTPFPVDELQTGLVDKTYLDTTGRPIVLIKKSRCSERHNAPFFITYTRSPLASLQKPAAVAAWMMAVFLTGGVLRRMEWRIKN